MRRRTVLIVSYHYVPAATPGSRRLDTMARLLARRGWQVVVLTATGGRHGEAANPDIEIIRTTRRELPVAAPGTAAIARPLVARIPLVNKAASFPDRYVSWNFVLLPLLLRLLASRHIDVVFSSSPPHSTHLAIAAARAVRRFKWVAEFRDPWMFPSRRRIQPNSAALQRRMERRVLARADRVIANTPGNRDALLAANPRLDPMRVRVSTNGFDESLFAPDSMPAIPSERADFTYVGEIYSGMLELYCAALLTIRARNPGNLPRLAVYGTISATERQHVDALGLGDLIEARGFVPHEESVHAMKNARALLALLPPLERWRRCVPSKMYWYLAARRPIVALVPEGDAAALVRDMHAGTALVDSDPGALGRELEAFVLHARAQPLVRLSGENLERYTMDTIAGGIDAILKEVTNGDSA